VSKNSKMSMNIFILTLRDYSSMNLNLEIISLGDNLIPKLAEYNYSIAFFLSFSIYSYLIFIALSFILSIDLAILCFLKVAVYMEQSSNNLVYSAFLETPSFLPYLYIWLVKRLWFGDNSFPPPIEIFLYFLLYSETAST
jgi:hypothetical protein